MLVTEKNYAVVMEKLDKEDKELIVDDETTGLNWVKDQQVGIAVRGAGESYYFPFRHIEGNLPIEKLKDLAPLLSKPDITYVGYNYGFDLKFNYRDGIPLPKKIQCVQVCAHLMNENEERFKLKMLGDKYVKAGSSQQMHDLDEELTKRGLAINEMGKLPPHMVEPYACQDVTLTQQLRDFYVPHLETWKLTDLYRDVCEYLLLITEMEVDGMQLNYPLMLQYIEESKVMSEKSREVIQKLAGYPINLNSSKQLQAWLKLKSTAAEILETMPDRPGVKELLEFRGWSRAEANYYRKFAEVMDLNHIVHPNLNITGTISGRLSAAKPPMQAIPVRTEVYKVKDVFVAREDEVLAELDYSQAELRVGSHYAEEKTMAEKLARGADIHTETATQIGIPRDAAKRLNFSVIYGIGAPTLSERLGIEQRLAKTYLNKYHSMYPGFKRLYKRCEAVAEQRGYIRMFSGRLRRFNVPQAYTHKASSNLIQGSVAEMIRIAMTRIRRELGVKMSLQVHDSIIARIPKAQRAELLPEMRRIMKDTPWCSVPMEVDVKTGTDWGHMFKAKFDEEGKLAA